MAIRLNRIYTKGGDKGKTSLIGGERVLKSSLQLDCYGNIDELNSHLGMLRTLGLDAIVDSELYHITYVIMPKLQNKLFDLGSLLAYPLDKINQVNPAVTEEDVEFLEEWMDKWNENLPELQSFVLPGGNVLNAHCHLARTVCRKCERLVVALSQESELPSIIQKYLNRLSDFLFVLSRVYAKLQNTPEFLWEYKSIPKP